MTFYAKLWTDIIGDEKLTRAARKGAKHLDKLPWLIAYAKKRDDSGRLSVGDEAAEPDDLAAGVPCVTPKMMAECTASLEAIGILTRDDDDVLRFANWRKRNWMSPSDTPDQVRERVANHRARKRGETNGNAESVTTPVTTGETTGETTPVTTARSRDIDVDVDRDLDTDKDRDVDADALAAAATTGESAIAARLTTDAGRNALTAIVAKAPNKIAWVQEMDASLTGLHGTLLTPAQLDEALREYVANGAFERGNFRTFRNYLRVAKTPMAEASSGAGRDRSGDSASFIRRPRA